MCFFAVLASEGKGSRKVIVGSKTVPTVTSGYCLCVSTGAPMPNGADAVVQVEDTELSEKKNGIEVLIDIKLEPTVGQTIRPVRSDVAVSECVLLRNSLISSAEVRILASVGRFSVSVFRKPLVTVLSTGNELSEPDTVKLTYGKIRDSNRTQLISLLIQHGFGATDGGIAVNDFGRFQVGSRPEYCRTTAVLFPDSSCLGDSVTGVNQASSRLTSNKNANLLLKLLRKTNEKPNVEKFEIVTQL